MFDADDDQDFSEIVPDLDLLNRIVNMLPDMGAYECSAIDCPVNDSLCPADIAPPGGDGYVNVDDLLLVINSWGNPGCSGSVPCAADIVPEDCLDGNVNVDDLLAVINQWGECEPMRTAAAQIPWYNECMFLCEYIQERSIMGCRLSCLTFVNDPGVIPNYIEDCVEIWGDDLENLIECLGGFEIPEIGP